MTTHPGRTIDLAVHAGARFCDLHEQDGYSYAPVGVHIGAANEADLTARFEQVVAALPFEIENVDG